MSCNYGYVMYVCYGSLIRRNRSFLWVGKSIIFFSKHQIQVPKSQARNPWLNKNIKIPGGYIADIEPTQNVESKMQSKNGGNYYRVHQMRFTSLHHQDVITRKDIIHQEINIFSQRAHCIVGNRIQQIKLSLEPWPLLYITVMLRENGKNRIKYIEELHPLSTQIQVNRGISTIPNLAL